MENKDVGIVPPALLRYARTAGIVMDSEFLNCAPDYGKSLIELGGASKLHLRSTLPNLLADVAIQHSAWQSDMHRILHRYSEEPSSAYHKFENEGAAAGRHNVTFDSEVMVTPSGDSGLSAPTHTSARKLVRRVSANAHSPPPGALASIGSPMKMHTATKRMSQNKQVQVAAKAAVATVRQHIFDAVIDADGHVENINGPAPTVDDVARQPAASMMEQPNVDDAAKYQEKASSAVCIAYQASMGLLRSEKLMKKSIHAAIGFLVMLITLKTLFPLTGAVVTGISSSTLCVKEVLPTASLPGYLLIVSTIAYLPAFCLIMAMFSQLVGNPFMSIAFFLIAASQGMNLYKGYVLIEANTKKKVQTMFAAAEGKIGKAKILAGVILIGYLIYIVYQIYAGGPRLDDLQDALFLVDWGEMARNLLPMAAKMAVTSIMFRFLTEIVCTDGLLTAIFDSADDELRAKQSGDMDEDRAELLKDWHNLIPPRKGRKSKKEKKKKKKGKDDDDEVAHQKSRPGSHRDCEWDGGNYGSGPYQSGYEQSAYNAPSAPHRGFYPSYHQ
jgi:hypothetical protein